ncbi:MAG: DUF192 domain-containing protein [Candidatus Dormibacteria bacterium]
MSERVQRRRLETAGGVVLADDLELATTVVSRFLGLMFRTGLAPGQGLLIRPCNSIHMFFMRFPVDVAFVDRNGVVLHILNGIRPWRVSRMVRGAKAAYELPAGSLAAAGIHRGDALRVV